MNTLVHAINGLVTKEEGWEGTATDLLAELDRRADERTRRLSGWPRSARALGRALRRHALDLQAIGIDVDFLRVGAGHRQVKLTRLPQATISNASSNDEQRQERSDNAGPAFTPLPQEPAVDNANSPFPWAEVAAAAIGLGALVWTLFSQAPVRPQTPAPQVASRGPAWVSRAPVRRVIE